jgi:hypothetical protein
MGFLIFCLWVVFAIILGIVLMAVGKKRKAEEGYNPETGFGKWVGNITPMVALFYIFSFLAAMVSAITVGTAEGEYSTGVVIVLVVACVMTFVPLLAVWNKWVERTVLDEKGMQYPRFLRSPARVSWDEVDAVEATVYKRRSTGAEIMTHIKIHTMDKVHQPTWDRDTWQRHRNKILDTIIKRAELVEEKPGYWARKLE